MREFYEAKFSLRFRTSVANEFQDFFASIMEHRYPRDFQKVKPYGKSGDRKCDGYHESLKRVFQVYAPEQMKVATTNSKIDEDFHGALKHWKKKIATWVFVHNQFRGLPADVLGKLLELSAGSHGVKVLRWCEPELLGIFFELNAQIQALLLGPAPTIQTFARVEMKDIMVVANAIAQMPTPLPEEVKEVAIGKLEANALTSSVQVLLRIGSSKSKLVKSFFAQWHDPLLGDRVAKAFRAEYQEAKVAGAIGDDIFYRLWKFAGGGGQASIAHEAAVLALLAFLFEECEIFEPAAKGATS